MSATNMKSISEFIKLIVEFGGVYEVGKDNFIRLATKDEIVTVKINNNDLPMMIFSEEMKTGKHTFFNPFVEVLGHSAERTWFMQNISMLFGVMMKEMMKKVVELTLEPSDDVDYDKLDIVRPFVDKVDKKLIAEIDKLDPMRVLRIVYNKKHRVAQAQTDLFETEYQESLKFRKGSWEPILGMMASFLGTDDVHDTYQYKATIISMQEMDSVLHIVLKLGLAMHQYVSLLLNKDLHIYEIEQHMEHLEEYRKACAWAVTGTIQHDRAAVKEDVKENAPWRATAVPTAPQYHNQFVPPQQFEPPRIGLPRTDPTLFARLAQQVAHNPYIDANQATACIAQNAYSLNGGPVDYTRGNIIYGHPGGNVMPNMGMPMPEVYSRDNNRNDSGGGGMPEPRRTI